MRRKVVALQMSKPVAQRRIRELALETGRIIQGPEVKRRMLERRITWQEIIKVLQHGTITEGLYLDVKGNWRCRIERFGAGATVRVVVAINQDTLW
jgi:hypothetical protein